MSFIIVICCPVAFMNKFVHLMLHFHWLRGSQRRADIFRYKSLSRKTLAFFGKTDEWETKVIATNPLQRSHYNKAILQQSDSKGTLFFLFFNFSLFVHRENLDKFLIGKF